MKYYVSYPLYIACTLQCWYCPFKNTYFRTGEIGKIGITVEQYSLFRDTYLSKDILVEFCGGETFLPVNVEVINEFLDKTTVEKADMLSNGIQPIEVYLRFVEKQKQRISRLGFSHHRTIFTEEQESLFNSNAQRLHKVLGDAFYIKEIFGVPGQSNDFSRNDSIPVVVQDFKGSYGDHFEEIDRPVISPFDYCKISPEFYRGTGAECQCRMGRKNVIITSKWENGDIIACWKNQVVVGNVIENKYNPAFVVTKEIVGTSISGVPTFYNKEFVDTELSKRDH